MNGACVSFAFDPNAGTCNLYRAPIRNQGYTSDAAATTTLANKYCYKCTRATTLTVQYPQPTPARIAYTQDFGYDGGSVSTSDDISYIQSYSSVYDPSYAYQGDNYLQILLDPPTDGTLATAFYYVVGSYLAKSADYGFSAVVRSGRQAQASSTSDPNCQAKLQAQDVRGNPIGDSGEWQDLSSGNWLRIYAPFTTLSDNPVTRLFVSIQCADDDYPSIAVDYLNVGYNGPSMSRAEL